MSIASVISSMQTNLSNAYTKVSDKGGTLPANKNLQNLANAIDSITVGGGEPNFAKYHIVQVISGNNCQLQIVDYTSQVNDNYLVGTIVVDDTQKIYIVDE